MKDIKNYLLNENEDENNRLKKLDKNGKPVFLYAAWSYLMSNGPMTKKDLMKGLGLKETSNGNSITRMKDQNIIKSENNLLIPNPENEWDAYGDRKKLQLEAIEKMKEDIADREEMLANDSESIGDIKEFKNYLKELKYNLKQLESHIGDPDWMPKKRYDGWYLW